MTEKNQKMKFGELVCMAICASFLIALLKTMDYGGFIVGAVGGGGGALLGIGIFYLFAVVKNRLVSSRNL
jgi:hypothetical protein